MEGSTTGESAEGLDLLFVDASREGLHFSCTCSVSVVSFVAALVFLMITSSWTTVGVCLFKMLGSVISWGWLVH